MDPDKVKQDAETMKDKAKNLTDKATHEESKPWHPSVAMTTKLQVAFVLGVMTAEHIHGTHRKRNQVLTDAIFRVLEQLASGELTLLDTPEETIADLPAPPLELAAKSPEAMNTFRARMTTRMPAMVRQAMRDQREVAAELLKVMT